MRALTKTFVPNINEAIKFSFSTVIPQTVRLLILLVCITWKYFVCISSHNKFMSTIDERSFKFVYKSQESDEDSCLCSVCLSEICNGEKVRELECKHVFHRRCVDRWLSCGGAATCPICRTTVVPKDTVVQYKHEQEGTEKYGFEKELALILLSTLRPRKCNGFSCWWRN